MAAWKHLNAITNRKIASRHNKLTYVLEETFMHYMVINRGFVWIIINNINSSSSNHEDTIRIVRMLMDERER